MVDPDRVRFSVLGLKSLTMQELSSRRKSRLAFLFPCEIENDVNCAGLAEAASVQAGSECYSLLDYWNRYRWFA